MSNLIKHERLHYLDAMRSILMILGIVLHSANVFSESDWAIQNASTSVYFSYIVEIIHLFRMPAFFIVSGFFCHMTLKQSGPIKFMNIRLPRIFIPLIITALTLNTFQNYILTSNNLQGISFTSFDYWVKGLWISHLWFLNSLLYYFTISSLLYLVFPRLLSRVKIVANTLLNHTKGLFPLILPIASIILIKISYVFPNIDEDYYGGAIAESIKYCIYFIFGIILGTNKHLLSEFVKPRLVTILASVPIFVWLHTWNFESTLTTKFALAYKTGLITWASCMACFYLFNTLLNKKSSLFSYLANASYTIYLFHHIFVIIFGLLIIKLDINIWIKFIFLVTLTFITTNLIHYFFISKFRVLSRLFNGKKLPG